MGDRPVIGSEWEDPTIDNPYLRQTPSWWEIEGTRPPPRFPWWQRTDKLVAIVVALLLLVACAQAALRAIT
jgi:hypothetical protein